MRKLILILAFTLLALPIVALAGLDSRDLPPGSTWYFHIDFKEMRSSKSGRHLYDWLDREAFDEILEETGVDVSRELDMLTAFDSGDLGPVILLQGNISQDSQDKMMAAAAMHGSMQNFKSKGKTFYFVEGDDHHDSDDDGVETDDVEITVDSFDDGAYFSFAVPNRVIITPSRERMEAMLASNGKVNGSKGAKNALLVLSAESNLLQAGANANEIGAESDDWDSNILRNTKQFALLIAGVGNQIALDARLITTGSDIADSMASIARGLIGLAALSGEVEPEVAELLRGTKVDVEDNELQISLAMDPEALVTMLDN